MNIKLSQDSDKTLCIIYKEYLNRRKNNLSKSNSINFEESQLNLLFSNKNQDDLDSELNELNDNSIVHRFIDGEIKLISIGIIYMENRFKDGLKEVMEFISKFIP